jgi:hypothetical protein
MCKKMRLTPTQSSRKGFTTHSKTPSDICACFRCSAADAAHTVLTTETGYFNAANRVRIKLVIRNNFLSRFEAFSVITELDVLAISAVVAIRLAC